MERTAVFCDSQGALNTIVSYFKEGWELDPGLKIVRLDDVALYHLVKYSEEELQALEDAVEPKETIVSIRSVKIEDADVLLQQGYEIADRYAKTVTLIKKEPTIFPGIVGEA